jgi:hypothetical protein
VGDSLNSIILISSRGSSVQMFYRLPFLCFNMIFHCLSILIDTNTNDSNFVTPIFSSVFNHFLIMSHRFLTGRTPSSPKINEENLTRFVLDIYRLVVLYINYICYFDEVSTSCQSGFNLNVCCIPIYSLEYLICSCLYSLNICFLTLWCFSLSH